jgi:beta-N-acetylhexosaminidase
LAPVVDLASESSRKVLGSRAVSADPAKTVRYAREFLAGLREARVLGALKHFPGLGGAALDTHHELPRIERSWKQLWDEDVAPFRALQREAGMMLIGHAAYPAVTKRPASISRKWIADVLRKKIGYRGLVISDDLEMGAVLKAGTVHYAAVEHIGAGGDLCLICHNEENVVTSYEALIRTAEKDRRFARRCQQSIGRVLAVKKKYKQVLKAGVAPTAANVERLKRQLWEFSEQVRLEGLEKAHARATL